LFGTGWLLTTIEIALLHRSGPEWQALTAILGLGLIYNMSEVYRLPAAPGWNTWRTNAGFFISAMLLGTAMMVPILAYESNRTGIQISSIQFMQSGSIVLILLLLQLALIYRRISESFLQNVRVKLLLLGVALTVLGIVQFTLNAFWISSLIFVVVLAEELLGRWLFYQSRI
jgi:DMSO reductase anchor subunit